jgi:hypothetical protein
MIRVPRDVFRVPRYAVNPFGDRQKVRLRQEFMACVSVSGCHWSYPTSALGGPPTAVSARVVRYRFVAVRSLFVDRCRFGMAVT